MSIQYGKPPITEAILDIRVEPRPGASAIEIAEGLKNFSEEYPNRQELPATNGFPLPMGTGLIPSLAAGPVLGGFRYESRDQKRILQLRRDAFVFSLLPPYQSWSAFSEIVRPLFEQYASAWRPKIITRVALRYVNRFSFTSQDMQTAGEYIGLLPQLPHPQLLPELRMAQYSLRLELFQEDIGATAIIQQAAEPVPSMDSYILNLDIDLYKDRLSLDLQDENTLWTLIGKMRDRKNDIFRACITDKTEERLEPKL